MIIQTFGSPFSHDVCSCAGREPQKHKYVNGKHPNSEVELYLDFDVLGGFQSDAKHKFLWLCESRQISDRQHASIHAYLSEYVSCYTKIFTCDSDIVKLHENIEYCPPASNASWVPATNQDVYTKSKLVSMISSGKVMCDGHRRRNALASEYSSHPVGVDMYGRDTNPFDTKEGVLKDYMFSITVENGVYSNYYTEKIMDCFATGTVPVYLGSPDIGDMFNPDGIITIDENFDLADLNKDLYESMSDAIEENFELQKTHRISDDILFEKILECL